MSKQSLLDRQVKLFQHLTSPELTFGDMEPASSDPTLRGMDLSRLRLEAEFSFMKRMGKIGKALPLTFKYLGARVPELSREFLNENPPTNHLRFQQASQFHSFLCQRWQHEAPAPEFLPDITRLEIAIARILAFRSEAPQAAARPGSPDIQEPAYRSHESAQLVHCRYDIGAVFARRPQSQPPVRRDVYLLVTMLFDYPYPRVFQIPQSLFQRMQGEQRWTATRSMLEDYSPVEQRSIESLHEIGALEYG